MAFGTNQQPFCSLAAMWLGNCFERWLDEKRLRGCDWLTLWQRKDRCYCPPLTQTNFSLTLKNNTNNFFRRSVLKIYFFKSTVSLRNRFTNKQTLESRHRKICIRLASYLWGNAVFYFMVSPVKVCLTKRLVANPYSLFLTLTSRNGDVYAPLHM